MCSSDLEYVKDKEVNRDNLLKLMLEYVKILKEQDITVRAGFSVDELGKVIYE